jgi:hypothetical protein
MYIHNRFRLRRSICRYRSLTHSMSIPPFSCTYPRDIRVYQAVKDVGASYDALVDLFESIESFLSRLDICTKVPLICAPMTDIVIKIMARSRSPLEDARCSGVHPCLSLVAASASCSTRNRTISIRPSLEARCNGVDSCSKLREFTFSECSMTKTLTTSCRPQKAAKCKAVPRDGRGVSAGLPRLQKGYREPNRKNAVSSHRTAVSPLRLRFPTHPQNGHAHTSTPQRIQ